MIYAYACVVGIKAPESLCYLLMYINPTLNKDYLRYLFLLTHMGHKQIYISHLLMLHHKMLPFHL